MRRRRVTVSLTLILLVVLSAYADRTGWFVSPRDDMHLYNQRRCRVVRVIDGDTVVIERCGLNKHQTTVRLWGVDTPELARAGIRAVSEPYAEAARDFTIACVYNQTVLIELESHQQRDKFGRLLAYVYSEDGRLLNELLLDEGLADFEPRFSHRFLKRFEQAAKRSATRRIGIWTD